MNKRFEEIKQAASFYQLSNSQEKFIEGAEWQKQKSMQDFFEKAEKILTERMYFSDDEAKEFKNYMQDESEN